LSQAVVALLFGLPLDEIKKNIVFGHCPSFYLTCKSTMCQTHNTLKAQSMIPTSFYHTNL